MKLFNNPKAIQIIFWLTLCLCVLLYITIPILSNYISFLSDYGSYTAIKDDLGLSFGEFLTLINVIILGYLTYKSYFRQNQQFVKELYFPFYKELMETTYQLSGDNINNKKKLIDYLQWIKDTNIKNTLFLVDDKIKIEFDKRKDKFITVIAEIEKQANIDLDSTTYKYFIDVRNYFLDYVGAIIMNQTHKKFKISTQEPPIRKNGTND